MVNLWLQFFIENFYNSIAPTGWQYTTIEIASVVMSFLVVLLAIVLIGSIICAIFNFARGLFR